MDALATELDDGTLPRPLLVEIARHAVASDPARAGDRAREELVRIVRSRPGRVINATGVLLHTNLGRARLADVASEAAAAAGRDATPIEFDLIAGRRGGRGVYAHHLLTALTGSEAALAVNNNAGALLLALAALAGDGSVIVSRGELIEIGGSFRLPELMRASGARLTEVGTTNRTRLADYGSAVTTDTRAILKVHPSNYRIEGFTADVGWADLAGLASEHGVPLIADVGSGLLDARLPWIDGPPPPWVADEPAVRQTLAAGASIVLFSGDKLLGGPQAGIAVGSDTAISAMRAHPIARAVRIAPPMLDALAATLELYATGRASEIPFWRMATMSSSVLRKRCEGLIAAAQVAAETIDDRSLPGAGTVPGRGIPGPVVLVPGDPETPWRRLLDQPTAVVARRDDRGLIVDLRAVDPTDDSSLAQALSVACR